MIFLPTIVTTVIAGLAFAVAAYELLWETKIVKHKRLVIYSMVMAFFSSLWCHYGMGYPVGILAILVFTGILFAEMLISHAQMPFDQVAACYMGAVVVPLLLGGLVRLHNGNLGRYYVMIPFLLAFTSDSGAYFAGRFLGKHKLAPNISPNKTVEGVIGGALGAILGMLIFCVILDLGFGMQANYLFALSYGILGSLAAVFGDLAFSAIKRQTGIKDYGNLLPGHGGILDRFDSMTVVAPLVEVLLYFIPVVIV